MTAKEEQLKKVEVQLKVWGHRIDRLQAKAMAQAVNGTSYQEQFNDLVQKRVELAQKFQALQHLNGDNRAALSLSDDIERTLAMIREGYFRTREKVIQASCLGWTEEIAQKRVLDSEGWVQGLGRHTGYSEGWVEGVGYQGEDSQGWTEGYLDTNSFDNP
jgi:hypothetical protein